MKVKRTTLLAVIITLVSCKKDYTCVCSEGNLQMPVNSRTVFTVHDTKKNAQKQCDNYLNDNLHYPETFCSLK